ncbi:virulence factor TspB C-terminal domain-related protein, partial [Acinetobacter sp. WCHAc060025]|uniref:virulence factor TspB C-terminal domain-related protein n=1 Tax=Acinetobacter sp. WCHAc060025 TaxID=2518625 RepID=UPI0022489889
IDLVSLPNPAYDPSKDEEKTLPLDVVANQVISNAESGDTDAQVATTAAAADIVNDAQNDSTKARPIVNQLEANAETKTEEEATGQSKPNTETGSTDLSLTFPVFCGWAPVVCEAAQVVISFPAKVEGWVSDLLGTGQKVEENTKTAAESTQAIEKELTKDDGVPEKDKTDINLPDLPITPETVNVNWGGSCPAPTTTNISFHGQSQEITILRYDFICEWAWVIKASVVALASIGAVFIISGRKT